MPQAVQSLPYVAWVLLVALSFGSFAFVVVTRHLTDATRGYLGFTAFCSGLVALLALVADWQFPDPVDLVIQSAPASTVFLRQAFLGVFALVCFLYPFMLRSSRSPLALGLMGLICALSVLGSASIGWAPSVVDAVPLLVQLVVLSLATGGSLAAVILGHWYLVTPKISEKPLILQARMLMAIVALQLACSSSGRRSAAGRARTRSTHSPVATCCSSYCVCS